jgi:hypothetical protein
MSELITKIDSKTIEVKETTESRSIHDIPELKKRKQELEFELAEINKLLFYDK